MKSQKSPGSTHDNSESEAAYWINRELIPANLRSAFLAHLEKSALTKEQRVTFLGSCNSLCNMVARGMPAVPADGVQKQIEKIRAAAKRLLNAINGASDEAASALKAHSDFLIHGSKPPARLPDSVLKKSGFTQTARDYVEALHLAADYTHDQINPSRQSSPAKDAAKGLIWHVARAYRAASGSLPPSSRNGWFCPFVNELGKQIGLACGPRIVEGVIRDLASRTH